MSEPRGMPTDEDIREGLRAFGRLLPDREAIRAAISNGHAQAVMRSRRAGKRAATQLAIAEALRDGKHVHFAEPDATYCVNAICPDLPADHPDYQWEWNLNLA